MTTGHLNTNKKWTDSLYELKEEFRKWGVQDYIMPKYSESRRAAKVVVPFVINGRWSSPECSRWGLEFDGPERNLRAIVMAIRSARLADQRGIGALLAEVTKHLMLPSGKMDPYAVLGVRPGVTEEILKSALRRREMETHPDRGGTSEAFREVMEAGKVLGLVSNG